MKKIFKLFNLAILLMTFSGINAQTSATIISGIHSANISASGINAEFLDFNSLNRFTGGIIVDHKLDNLLTARTGLIYRQKGFQISETTGIDLMGLDIPVGVKVSTEVHTINVPLQLGVSTVTRSGIEPYLMAGPNFSYASSGSINTRATALFDFSLTETPLNLSSDDYNRLGIEGLVTVGTKVSYGSGFFLAEVNYSHSFNDFTSNSFIVDAGIKNRGVSFNVGFGMSF